MLTNTKKRRIKMKRLVLISLCVLFATGGSLSAALLVPMNTFVDFSIEGMVGINGRFDPPPKYAMYGQRGHSDGLASGNMQLAASVMTGNIPGCPHNGTVGSSAGVEFEQIALNEYVLTLTSTAMGQLFEEDAPGFDFGNLDGHSSLSVRSDFLMLGQPGATSTIMLELEHFGTLSSVNNGRASSQTRIGVFAPGPGPDFVYDSFLETPMLPTEFEWSEFTGTRNIIRNWSILTYVGEMISLNAEFSSEVFANLNHEDAFDFISASSNFESGIRLHMTVMPEPATIALLGFGGLLIGRSRKFNKKRK
jgi:hypothetical protein